MRRNLRQLSPIAIVLILVVPGISQAQGGNNAEAAKARRQIQTLKDDITGLNILIFTADATIATTKAAIKKEENKPEPSLGDLFALNLTLAGLEAGKQELLKEKRSKQRQVGEWEAYLDRVGG